MNLVTYILKGFGYGGLKEFKHSLFNIAENGFDQRIGVVVALGTARFCISELVGLDLTVFAAFLFLIIAEFQTGIRASLKTRGEKIQSRKIGRMVLKVGTYSMILATLNTLSKGVTVPEVMGFELNPFTWLYYVVFVAIVFQLVISWFENLGSLGYRETKTIAGFILRKFNKWFEFDGNKSNISE